MLSIDSVGCENTPDSWSCDSFHSSSGQDDMPLEIPEPSTNKAEISNAQTRTGDSNKDTATKQQKYKRDEILHAQTRTGDSNKDTPAAKEQKYKRDEISHAQTRTGDSNNNPPAAKKQRSKEAMTSLKEEEAIARVADTAFADKTRNSNILRAQQIVAGTTASQLSRKIKAKVAKALESVHDTLEKEEKFQLDKGRLEERSIFVRQTEQALLGYGKISFATINDLGHGPDIIRGHLNPRPINRSGITKLQNLYLSRSLNQTSTEKNYHLKVLVRRETVDVDKLTRDPSKPNYPRIVWADDIKNQIKEAGNRILATVADGNHRATLTEQVTSAEVKKYKDLFQQATTTETSQETTEEIEVAKEHLEILRCQIENISCWNCAVFDWDKLEESENSDALLLRISENDLFFNQPDTNEESLLHLLRSISGRQDVSSLLMVHRQGHVVQSTTLDSIFKDEEALIAYAKPYEFQALRDVKLWKPKLIFQWQSSATPILSPYIYYMLRILQWLASCDDIDLEDDNNVAIVADMLAGDDDLSPILDDRLFDKAFFDILEGAYMRKLQYAIISFGCGSDMDDVQLSDFVADISVDSDDEFEKDVISEDLDISWTRAYNSYVDELCETLRAWSKKRLQTVTVAIDDPGTKMHVVSALKKLVPRIKFIHRHKIFIYITHLPTTTSPPPLMSILFYTDLAKSLADVSDGIALTYTWFEPLLLAMSHHTYSKKQADGTDFGIRKPPKLFYEWLVYHFVRSKPIQTIMLSSKEKGRLEQVRLTMAKINGVILRHRESSLLSLNKYFVEEKRIWKKYEVFKYKFESRTAYKIHLSKLEPGKTKEPDWMPKAVLATEMILKWRQEGQKLERAVQNEEMQSHHGSRDGSSKRGTLFKPQLAAFPNQSFIYDRDSEEEEIHQMLCVKNMLFLTACNWGGFINNNAKSTRYVLYVLQAVEVRESVYKEQILRDDAVRGVFDDVAELVNILAKGKLKTHLTLPDKPLADKGKGREQKPRVPVVHASIAQAEVELIDEKLRDGILKLQELVKTHGSVCEEMSAPVVQGYRALSLALTEVAMWNAGVLTGNHSANDGNIELPILKNKLETINVWFPEEGSGLTARKAAKLMKLKTLADVSGTTAESRPSKKIAGDWSKDEKRAVNKQKKMTKTHSQHKLLRVGFQDFGESVGVSKQSSSLVQATEKRKRTLSVNSPPKISDRSQTQPRPKVKKARLEDNAAVEAQGLAQLYSGQ